MERSSACGRSFFPTFVLEVMPGSPEALLSFAERSSRTAKHGQAFPLEEFPRSLKKIAQPLEAPPLRFFVAASLEAQILATVYFMPQKHAEPREFLNSSRPLNFAI